MQPQNRSLKKVNNTIMTLRYHYTFSQGYVINNNQISCCFTEIFSCQYLQLETASEVNTELIAFEVVEFEAHNKTNNQKQSPEEKKSPDSSFNICATSVKVISKFTF